MLDGIPLIPLLIILASFSLLGLFLWINLRVVPAMNEPDDDAGGLNVVCLLKDGERYIFIWDDAHTTDMYRTLGRFAANPELSFGWYEATVCSQRMRECTEWIEPGQAKALVTREEW